MAGAVPEKQTPEQKEVFRPFITPGIARFMAAAHGDLAFKKVYNPQPLTFDKPGDKQAMTKALEEGDPTRVDIPLLDRVSTSMRTQETQQKEQAGENNEQQMIEWAEGMVGFLRNLSTTASPEQEELLRKRLGVDLSQTDENVLWEQTGVLWDKYLVGESNIEQFFADVLTGIRDSFPKNIAEMQRRIALVEPFLGMFGDERISILIRDAANASILLNVGGQYKKDIIDLSLQSLQQDFSTTTQKESYKLLWSLMKNNIPPELEQTQVPQPVEKVSPQKETTPPPAPPPVPEERAPSERVQPRQVPQVIAQPAEERAVSPSAPLPEGQQQLPQRQEPHPQEVVPVKEEQRPPVAEEARRNIPPKQGLLPESSRSAAVTARNPERPWVDGDALFAREFAEGAAFALGAFDALDNGGMYSTAISQKLRHMVAKHLQSYTETPPVDVAIRRALNVFEEIQPFIDQVKSGAEKELDALKINDRQKKEIVGSIGTTGLLGITAKDGDSPVLVTMNLGNSRLIAFDPKQGSVTPLTVDQTIAARKLRLQQVQSEDEAFIDPHRANLSRWIKPTDVDDLERKFQDQMLYGWGRNDDMLRVIPLKKGNLYLALTNGVTFTIPPSELPKVIQRAYNNALAEDGTVDMGKVVRYVVKEARKRMLSPDQYRLTVKGRSEKYVVSDDAGAAGIAYAG